MSALQLELDLDGLQPRATRRVPAGGDPLAPGPFLWELGAVPTRRDLDRLLRTVQTVRLADGSFL